VQIYDLPGGAVWHLDLFRLERATDIWELGIEEGMASAIVLIEWPERMTSFLPPDRLAIEFASGAREDSRRIRLIAHGGWRERFAEIAGDV
jgi:tRNA threonylcarbamoyladenosine biosynthesis protein TsaE